MLTALARRAEQIEALTAVLPGQIHANREQREGRPVELTRSQKKTIRRFERDARHAAAEIQTFAASAPVRRLLEVALGSERDALRLERQVYGAMHGDDERLGRPILRLREANIAVLEGLLSAPNGLQDPGTTESGPAST